MIWLLVGVSVVASIIPAFFAFGWEYALLGGPFLVVGTYCGVKAEQEKL